MQFLAGSKTYLVGAAMIAYAALGYFHPSPDIPAMSADAAIKLAFAALALMGMRSGITTEVQKLLAALGIDVAGGQAKNPLSIQNAGTQLISYLGSIARNTAVVKSATLLLLAAFVLPLVLLSACASNGSQAQTVAELELAYTPAAGLAAKAISSGITDAPTTAALVQLNDAIDTRGPNGTRQGLLVAARTAAMSGDSVTAAAETEALRQAIAALVAYEAAHSIK